MSSILGSLPKSPQQPRLDQPDIRPQELHLRLPQGRQGHKYLINYLLRPRKLDQKQRQDAK